MALDLSAATAAANAMAYDIAPFASGFIIEDYRARYREHGTQVRVWHAVDMPDGAAGVGLNGRKYVEQVLDPAVRVLLSSKRIDDDEPDSTLIRVGDLQYAGIPDEILLRLNSRVLVLDDERDGEFKASFTVDETLELPRLHIARVEAVYTSSGAADVLDYQIEDNVIRWINGSPPAQVTVQYWYHPQYEFRGDGDKQAFLAGDGGRMPQIVPLHLLAEGEENS